MPRLKASKTSIHKGLKELNESSNYTLTRQQTIKVDHKRIAQLKTSKAIVPTTKHSAKTLMKMIKSNNKTDKINVAGQFVLLTAINVYLSGDFEYCHRICSRNFTYVVNNPLFEGNLHRFKALAAEQLFIHQKTDSDIDISLLFAALESAQQALSFFGAKKQGVIRDDDPAVTTAGESLLKVSDRRAQDKRTAK